MKRKPFGILRHAVKMVGRNIRSYAMLSVTIILSFSILLGFMGYMDTEHYNTNKKILALDRGFLRFVTSTMSPARVAQLEEKAAQYGTSHCTQYYQCGLILHMDHWRLATGERISGFLGVTTFSVPRECWFLEKYPDTENLWDSYTVTWLDGREDRNITLETGEILMDDQLFKAFGLSKENNKLELSGTVGTTGGEPFKGTYTVVGTIPANGTLEMNRYTDERTGEPKANFVKYPKSDHIPVIVFSMDDFNPLTVKTEYSWLRRVFFHSDQPENVHKMLETMEPELTVYPVYEVQNRVLETIRTEKGTKAIIAALLMLILGINLYSSFENALNDRKFEIGVKRAMGASGFSIIRQFFYESMIVMVANILISVALVVDLGLLLKLYRQLTLKDMEGVIHFEFETYSLYITPYSVGMFAVCAVVLTVVFSFVFAYKTTQVQIVDYLKAE